MAEALDRLERAAMAYERLGKVTRDDDKSRELRKNTIAELADARRALLDHIEAISSENERLRADLAFADEQAKKLEALLEPHVSWEGKPSVFDRLWDALDDSLKVIHALEKLADIERGGYPRPSQEETLRAIIDEFLDRRRRLLSARAALKGEQ